MAGVRVPSCDDGVGVQHEDFDSSVLLPVGLIAVGSQWLVGAIPGDSEATGFDSEFLQRDENGVGPIG